MRSEGPGSPGGPLLRPGLWPGGLWVRLGMTEKKPGLVASGCSQAAAGHSGAGLPQSPGCRPRATVLGPQPRGALLGLGTVRQTPFQTPSEP